MTIKALSQWNKPKLQAQSCANCNAFLPNKAQKQTVGQAQVGWCRANPPVAAQVMVANAIGQPQSHWQGVFPPTMADYWCRAHEEVADDDGPTAAA